jgi:hypothetical protein
MYMLKLQHFIFSKIFFFPLRFSFFPLVSYGEATYLYCITVCTLQKSNTKYM